jgi:GNAT superfamily N-acetyltransferase
MAIRRKNSRKVEGQLQFKPLTIARWNDFEQLFGERGACAGCWCMFWRLNHSTFERHKGAANRRAMNRIVAAGEIPGILAYLNSKPIGWCAVAPREKYLRLQRSRVLAPVDGEKVWSIVCLFVARPFRRRGISSALIRAACEFVCKRGGKIVEGYPIEPRKSSAPDAFVWTGLASAFRQAGFTERKRRSPTRPIMRRPILRPRTWGEWSH